MTTREEARLELEGMFPPEMLNELFAFIRWAGHDTKTVAWLVRGIDEFAPVWPSWPFGGKLSHEEMRLVLIASGVVQDITRSAIAMARQRTRSKCVQRTT